MISGLEKLKKLMSSAPTTSVLNTSNDCVILDGTLSGPSSPVCTQCRVRVMGPSGVHRFTIRLYVRSRWHIV